MQEIKAKTILSSYKKENAWFGVNYTMNLYRGCCHRCIYCDSRSECYSIDSFDNVCIKSDAINILKSELKSKRNSGIIFTGSMSDPYNPFEEKFQYTRKALELINKHWYGIAIATKSDLITRDIDILKEIKDKNPVLCKFTITCSDDNLSKIVEPNVCSSSDRFKAMELISKNGIYTGVLLMPILPFINDTSKNITEIVKKSANSGAKFIYPFFGVTLRDTQRSYFYNELDRWFPEVKGKYVNSFGGKYSCISLSYNKLRYDFKNECEKLGLLYKMPDIIKDYKYDNNQLSLFN